MTEKKLEETVEKTERHVITGDDQPAGTDTAQEKTAPQPEENAGNSAKEDKPADDKSDGSDKSE